MHILFRKDPLVSGQQLHACEEPLPDFAYLSESFVLHRSAPALHKSFFPGPPYPQSAGSGGEQSDTAPDQPESALNLS